MVLIYFMLPYHTNKSTTEFVDLNYMTIESRSGWIEMAGEIVYRGFGKTIENVAKNMVVKFRY